jgi:hypothetical protein
LGDAVQQTGSACSAHPARTLSGLAFSDCSKVGTRSLFRHLTDDVALQLHRHKDDLAASRFGHLLH